MARTKRDAINGVPPGLGIVRAAIQKAMSVPSKAAAEKKTSASEQAKQNTSSGVFGEYIIEIVKQLEDDDDWEEYPMSVFPDPSGRFFWAKFELDCVEGCMKFGPGRVGKGQTTHDFQWRGRDTGDGEIECGSENKGSLSFFEDGVKGKIDTPFGQFKLFGDKISNIPEATDSSTWETCTEEQHELERVARSKR